MNKDFRQAITFALNRENYSAQVNSKAFAKPAIRNTYTAPAFVQVNGKDFGDVVADKLSTYGDQMERCQPSRWSRWSLTTKTKQKHKLEKAKAELQKEWRSIPNSY